MLEGQVFWSPLKSLWFTAMLIGAVLGGTLYFSWAGVMVFVGAARAELQFYTRRAERRQAGQPVMH